MELYEPKSFCICFDTKNGSLIIASLSLIGAILSILSAVCGPLAYFLDAYLELFVQTHQLDHSSKELLYYRDNIIMCVISAVLAYCSFVGVCSSLLIHGIRKDRPGLMMPYLVFQRVYIIMEIITIFVGTVIVIFYQLGQEFMNKSLLLGMMAATIDIYFHLVINAYHKQVKRAVCGGKVYYKEVHNECNDYKGKF